VSSPVQGVWWLVPFGLLMIVMLHAMMEFTVSLLVQRPHSHRNPIATAELRQRLLTVNQADRPFQLAEGQDCDLELRWEQAETPRPGRLAIAKAATGGRLRVLLDEQRHEVRLNEVARSYYLFAGFTGWLPRLAVSAALQSGPPGHAWTKEVAMIAHRGGWSVRPVLWWFQATFPGYRILQSLTPAPLRRWPARRFWGVLYPLSYALGMGCLVAAVGALDRRDLLLLGGVSAAWWGIWGSLAWILCGFPAFWRRKRR
jgi:hypothetical protein